MGKMIVRGQHYQNDQVVDFHLADGVIQAVLPADPYQEVTLGGEGFWVAPGLVDIQVNGYQGYDFCSGDTTPDDVLQVARGLVEAGVTGFCPTVTTNSKERMLKSFRAIARAVREYRLVRERVVGIHVEGPYLSPQDGPRGAHPAEPGLGGILPVPRGSRRIDLLGHPRARAAWSARVDRIS
jgi:N-acetylglucosamine-6-phosphate deacetylase